MYCARISELEWCDANQYAMRQKRLAVCGVIRVGRAEESSRNLSRLERGPKFEQSKDLGTKDWKR